MQRFPRFILLIMALAIGYWAWPLHAALQLRNAMISGDTATLARRVDWDKVRVSLKASIAPEALARLEADPNAPKPSMWQRVKGAVAPHLATTVVDRYVTPENLPVLLGYRRIWRDTVRPTLGYSEPPTALADTAFEGTAIDRFASFWKRLRRAVIYSPAKVVVEIEDKYNPARSFIGTLELRGMEWKLTELAIAGEGF